MSTLNHTKYEPTADDVSEVIDKRAASGADTLSDAELKQIALQSAYKQNTTIQNTPQRSSEVKFPTEVVDLPSSGLVYPPGHPLSSGQIEMKYMTAKEEDILASPNLARQGVILDKLFQSLIVTPVPYEDLYIGDRNGIMVAARLLSYGKAYKVIVDDPTLPGEKQEVVIDLESLTAKPINTEFFESSTSLTPSGEREFFFDLPNTKVRIGFKFLTVRDDNNIRADLKRISAITKKTGIEREASTRLKYVITSVDGDYDRDSINAFVDEGLLVKDSYAFREYYREVSPDIDFKFTFVSKLTGESAEMEVPINTNFFWPR